MIVRLFFNKLGQQWLCFIELFEIEIEEGFAVLDGRL